MKNIYVNHYEERGPMTLSTLIENAKKRLDPELHRISHSGLGDISLDTALGSVAGLMGLEEFAHTPEFKALDKLIQTKRLQAKLLRERQKLMEAQAEVETLQRELAAAS